MQKLVTMGEMEESKLSFLEIMDRIFRLEKEEDRLYRRMEINRSCAKPNNNRLIGKYNSTGQQLQEYDDYLTFTLKIEKER